MVVSPSTSQQSGWEQYLQNVLFSVKLDIKPLYLFSRKQSHEIQLGGLGMLESM